jgi:hypothetical protein
MVKQQLSRCWEFKLMTEPPGDEQSPERCFELYRRVIEHEDHLVNHRFSWLLVAQSFLLGACISAGRIPWGVRWLGGLLCGVCLLSIIAAVCAILHLRQRYGCLAHDDVLPPIVGQGWKFPVGMAAPLLSSFIFLLAWIVLPTCLK